MRYVFGPVPSRRLGRSLGVDVVPLKTCTYDCIYCQLGRTTRKTIVRQDWTPLELVVGEVREALTTRPNFITISGSGEPTLYSRLGELIEAIRRMTSIPVAVLTNGSLLWDEEVSREVALADLVMPSLDAGTADMFARVNRPHASITFNQMLDGLIGFRSRYHGQLWLEVFLVSGYGGSSGDMDQIARAAARIEPDRIQLNTVTRPPSETTAGRIPFGTMQEYAPRFTPAAEVITASRDSCVEQESCATCEDVLNLLRRRPCSLRDVADGLGIHLLEAAKHLEVLAASSAVESLQTSDTTYYRVRS